MYALAVSDHIMIAHSFNGEIFGPAQQLHGATYGVEVEFRRVELDGNGLVCDIGLHLKPEIRLGSSTDRPYLLYVGTAPLDSLEHSSELKAETFKNRPDYLVLPMPKGKSDQNSARVPIGH